MFIFLISSFVFNLFYVHGATTFRRSEDPYFQDIPLCNTDRDACDISLVVNGGHVPASQQACRCRGQVTCSRGEDAARTVTRVLNSRGQSLLMKLSYCNPIGTGRTCVGNEVAVIMQGGGVIPTKIVTSNCMCPEGQPMLLQRTFHPPRTWMVHQEFVCMQDVCPTTSDTQIPCKTTTRSARRFGNKHDVTRHCQCPEGYSCVSDYNSRQRQNHGYCQRV